MTRHRPSLDSLALKAMQQARCLHEQLAGLRGCPTGELAPGTYQATLRRLETGAPIDDRDLHVLETLARGIDARLAAEITGSREEGRIIGCDEEGVVWGVGSVPTYTPRGEALAAAGQSLAAYLALRRDLLDQVRAERLLLSLMR